MSRHLWALLPRDGYFLKDSRGWQASASGRARSLDWPPPLTLRGALRTAYGRWTESQGGTTLKGEQWRTTTDAVALRLALPMRRVFGASWDRSSLLWPVPRDALYLEGERDVHMLLPVGRNAGEGVMGAREDAVLDCLAWPQVEEASKPLPPPRWWSSDRLALWLCGKPGPVESLAHGDYRPPVRTQVHVSMDADSGTALRSALFSSEVVEPLARGGRGSGGALSGFWEWGMALASDLPVAIADPASLTLLLGGDRRICRAEVLPSDTLDLPQRVEKAFAAKSPGLRLLLVTPALLEGGWLPGGFIAKQGCCVGRLPGIEEEVCLRAAFVDRPAAMSGWDIVRRAPKPTLRLAPEGSVYFFTKCSGASFGIEDARALWLATLGARPEDGLGRVVPGTWDPEACDPKACDPNASKL